MTLLNLRAAKIRQHGSLNRQLLLIDLARHVGLLDVISANSNRSDEVK